MIFKKTAFAAAAIGLCLGAGMAQAQDDPPPLPFEDGLTKQIGERLGLTGFEALPTGIPGNHSDVPRPPLTPENLDDLLPPPHLPQIRRYYIYCYYYASRPWFVHPYTGATLRPWQVLGSVQSQNPDWLACAKGKSLQQLIEDVDPQLGEPLVQVDQMLVDENSEEAMEEWKMQQEAEQLNFDEVGKVATLNPAFKPIVRPIWHAPFYGLYCLRVRICVPILTVSNHLTETTTGIAVKRWRFWCRFPFRRHQPVCWKRWWWYRWSNQTVLRPWRPWCLPYVRWTRSGPDWVCHVTSVNRWRRWCLWGFRYYFNRIIPGEPTFTSIDVNNVLRLPRIAGLNSKLDPDVNTTTGWLRPWPYPRVRYWPFRPYCTRWYWFRGLPWWWYRHFPPIIHFAVAVPKPELGGGFDPNPDIPADDPQDPLFSVDPPNLADGEAQSGQTGRVFDSFFDIDVECRGRADLHPVGDMDGSGVVQSRQDLRLIGVRQLLTLTENPDTEDLDEDPNRTGN